MVNRRQLLLGTTGLILAGALEQIVVPERKIWALGRWKEPIVGTGPYEWFDTPQGVAFRIHEARTIGDVLLIDRATLLSVGVLDLTAIAAITRPIPSQE